MKSFFCLKRRIFLYGLSFNQSIFNFNSFKLVYHRLRDKPKEERCSQCMYEVKRYSHNICREYHRLCWICLIHNDGCRVYNSTIYHQCCKKPEDAERCFCPAKESLSEKYSRDKTDNPKGKHLPRRPRTLPEEKV